MSSPDQLAPQGSAPPESQADNFYKTLEANPAPPEQRSPSLEGVKMLEQSPIDSRDKIDFLLIATGTKPASSVRFDSPTEEVGNNLQPYIDAAQAMNLMVEIDSRTIDPHEDYAKGTEGQRSVERFSNPYPENSQLLRRTLMVAKTAEALALIKQAEAENSIELYGRAFGFPETAVQAYAEQRSVLPVNLGITDPELLAFATFGLSPEHAAEELSTARRWAEAAKTASPELYSQNIAKGSELARHAKIPEIDQPNQEAIQLLEQSDLPIQEKSLLLLTIIGEKPVNSYRILSPIGDSDENPQPVSEADYAAYMAILNKAGLIANTRPDNVIEQSQANGRRVQRNARVILAGKTQDDIDQLANARKNHDTRAVGKIFGYPETAVQAFIDHRSVLAEQIGVSDPAILPFARYGLSPEHWEEELELARRWSKATREASPKIYDELTRQHQFTEKE